MDIIRRYKNKKSWKFIHIYLENFIKRSEEIDLEVQAYNRGFIATQGWQELLLQSIFMRPSSMPPVHIRQLNDKRDDYWWECIDGLQRLNTILRCAGGYVQCPKGTVVDGIDLSGMNCLEIAERHPRLYRQKFLKFQLDIKIYIDHSDEEAAEIFWFINHGTALNAANKRNSIQARITEVLRGMARTGEAGMPTHGLFDGSWVMNKSGQLVFQAKHLALSRTKMEFDELLARMLHFIIYGEYKQMGDTALEQMYRSDKFSKSFPKKYIRELEWICDIILLLIELDHSTIGYKDMTKRNVKMLYMFLLKLHETYDIYIQDASQFMKMFRQTYKQLEKETISDSGHSDFKRALSGNREADLQYALNKFMSKFNDNFELWGFVV